MIPVSMFPDPACNEMVGKDADYAPLTRRG